MIELSSPFQRVRQVPHVTTTPVTDEFHGLWITDIMFRGTPTGPTSAVILLHPYDPETGVMDLTSRRQLTIDDVMNLATTDQGVEQTMNTLLVTIGRLAAEQGLTAPGAPAQSRIQATPPDPA